MRHHLVYLEPPPQRTHEWSQMRTNALEPRECEKSTKWGLLKRCQSELSHSYLGPAALPKLTPFYLGFSSIKGWWNIGFYSAVNRCSSAAVSVVWELGGGAACPLRFPFPSSGKGGGSSCIKLSLLACPITSNPIWDLAVLFKLLHSEQQEGIS